MKRAFRLLIVAGALATAARAAIGCATNDDSHDEAPVAIDADASLADAPAVDGAVLGEAGHDAHAAAPSTCSADGWCYTSLPEAGSYDASALPQSLPGTTFALRSVWVGSDQRPWAVSTAGHVLHGDGTTWRVETIASRPLRAVWGWGTTDIWVAGENGLVLHGTIAGGTVTFQPVTVGTTQTIARIVGTSASDVWAIADGLGGFGTLNRVFRLNAAGTAFVASTVPSTFTDSTAKLRLSALWTAGGDVWVAGYETTCGGPGKCKFRDELVALKWNGIADGGAESGADGGADGGSSWDHVPLLRSYSNPISAGAGTNDGVQMVTIRDYGDQGYVARITTDETKLDAGAPDADAGPSHEGAYAWTNELAETFGAPNALWATSRNDVWLVGKSGTIRHYDGSAWQLIRLSLTSLTPLLRDLHDIHAVVDASGKQEIWVVGDDVAIHRTVKP